MVGGNPDPRDVYLDVNNERWRAHEKHKVTGGSMEDRPWGDAAWLPVVTEEVGEVAHELNEAALDPTGDYRDTLREELVQVAAVACAWIVAIDRSIGPSMVSDNSCGNVSGKLTTAITSALQLMERQTVALERIAETLDAATQGPNYGFWTKETDR